MNKYQTLVAFPSCCSLFLCYQKEDSSDPVLTAMQQELTCSLQNLKKGAGSTLLFSATIDG